MSAPRRAGLPAHALAELACELCGKACLVVIALACAVWVLT